MKNGARFLDVGCGVGNITEICRMKFNEIYGCDISKNALMKAKERDLSTVCVDLNVDFIPFKDQYFDCITALEAIEHLLNPLSFLKELYRILKPDGQLLITTPNIRYFRNLHKLTFDGIFPHTTTDDFVWGGGHIHYFTTKDITLLLTQVGFKKISLKINQNQFYRSWKRRIIRMIIRDPLFCEFFCGGITVEAVKE